MSTVASARSPEVAFYIIAYAVRSGSQASHRAAWVHHKSL